MATYERDPLARTERNERIVELRLGGMTQPEIAAETGVSTRTVQRILRDAELTNPDRFHERWGEDVWERVEAWLREEEGSYSEAARTFGPSAPAIAARFPELGWRRQEAGRWAGQVNRIAHQLYRATYANA